MTSHELGWTPRIRRWLTSRRILIISVTAVMALLVIANQVLTVQVSRVASREISSHVQLELVGADRSPRISTGNSPILFELASGNIHNVNVRVDGICTPGPRLSSVNAQFHNVNFSLGKAIHGQVPVDTIGSLTGSVTVDYADVNAYLHQYQGSPTISSDGKAIKVSVDVPRKNQTPARVSLAATFVSQTREIQIVPTQLGVDGYGTLNLDSKAFTFPVDLDSVLPQKVDITSVDVTPRGAVIHFSGSNISVNGLINGSATSPSTPAVPAKPKSSVTSKCLTPLQAPTA